MDPLIWFGLAAFGVTIGAGLVYFVMTSRMEVLLAEQRTELAAARATIDTQRLAMTESLKTAEASARNRAMEEFLGEIRIEERHYTREHKMLFMSRKCLVRQERIFFRNIPLSNWIEQEMPIEEGADVEQLAQTMSVFAAQMLGEPVVKPAVKLLKHG